MISFRDLLAPGLIRKIDETQGSVPLFSASQSHPSQSLMGRDASGKENIRPLLISRTEATPVTKRTLETPFTAKIRTEHHFPIVHEMRSTRPAVSPMHEATFFTPLQSASKAYGASSTGIHETPFKSLPKMEMLGLDFIQQCQDPSTLQDIIRVLSDVPATPTLLRTAKARYNTLCVTSAMTSPAHERLLHASNGSSVGLVPANSPAAAGATPGQPRNDSSLYFSIDSETQEYEKEVTDATSQQPLTPHGLEQQSIAKGDIISSRLFHFNERDNVVETKDELSKPDNQLECIFSSRLSDGNLKDRLQSEIERLVQQVKNLETNQWHAQQDFTEQIESLVIDRRQIDQKLTALHEQVKDSLDSKQEILETIDKMQLEQKRLNRVFRQHRQDWLGRTQEPTAPPSRTHMPQNLLRTHVQAPHLNSVGLPHGISEPSTEPFIASASATKTPKSALKKAPVSGAGATDSINKRVTLNLYDPPISPNAEGPTELHTPEDFTFPRIYTPHTSTVKRLTSTSSPKGLLNVPPSSSGTQAKEALMLKRQAVQRSGGLKALKEQYRRARSPKSAASPRLPLKALT